MKAGEFEDGKMTLRAKIDLASGNFNMRDPVIYRINRLTHHRTGDKWCIYPMYDFAHPIEDAIEVSLTAFAHLSLRLTVRFTIGLSIIFPFLTSLVRLSLPVLVLTTQLCQSVNSVNLLKRIM